MAAPRHHLLSIALAGVAAVAAFKGCMWLGDELLYGPAFHKKVSSFEKVRPGMTREQVVEILGEPTSRGAAFHLGQSDGFEAHYARAAKSDSKEWYFWSGGDLVMAVGFARSGRVAMAAAGGT